MSGALKTIPLNQLKRAKLNARKTNANADIQALAASIAAHGLLQNLTVRLSPEGGGDQYEVVAGGRRLAALKLLAKRKKIEPDFPVPCAVIEDKDGAALEASLAENVTQSPLHPADQFEAFSKLAEEGHGIETIAARFGVSPITVRQRLKLAAVSPKLMRCYRDETMTLDQLMAFTVSDDRSAQEQFWFSEPYGDKSPYAIRRALTQTLVAGTDRRARFIGAEAYEAAGGAIRRDLFDTDGEGYFEDSRLLDTLVAEKLAAEAKKVEAEGWAWVQANVESDYVELARYNRVSPVQKELPKKEQKRLEKLCERYDRLVEELEEEGGETDELDEVTEEIDRLSAKMVLWSKEDMSRAGAYLTLDYHGNVSVTRGLLTPTEKPKQESADASNGEKPNGKANGLSEALIEELSAHRTAALQETLAGKPDVALVALLHALVVRTFTGEHHATCIDVNPTAIHLGGYGDGVSESPALAALAERHGKWSEALPEDGLWEWLVALPRKRQLELLAYCTARTVNAVRTRRDYGSDERLAQADVLAQALSLDMSRWWQPTRESCLERMTKQQILECVTEAKSLQAAENIANLKKAAMAEKAEGLLAGKGWLPEALRTRKAQEEKAADAA